mmetsp:Transcript_42916/g.142089  ORF Transcript_42916/g.142089 Transcript_42916/m.142089 type:complete len:568 (-) Transcript_42916:345-2048(-)
MSSHSHADASTHNHGAVSDAGAASSADMAGGMVPTPADLLIMAVRSGSKEMSQGVIAQHPEALQGRDTEDGATAVHWASLLGHAELVEWLIEQGAPHDWAVESSGMQPIHWAATRGHTDVIKVLLKRGANIDARDVKGTTPLVIASQYDHTVLVFFLVQQRADINLLDVYSDSALHWAAYKNNQQTVALLHYLGLPADAADSYGSTPMHLASAQGSLQVIEYIIEATPNPTQLVKLKDNKGRTPIDVARERGYRHVLQALAPLNPAPLMRCFYTIMGQGGASDKVMFYFFWVNSFAAAVTYYRLAQEVDAPMRHLAFASSFLGMYLFIFATYMTDPGSIDTSGDANAQYRRALELAADGRIEEATAIGPLCHTCHIARPLRSKHCGELKRCVSAFDHHCPYVHNTIGARNYALFIAFMFCGLVAIPLDAALCLEYLLRVGRNGWVLLQLCDHLLFSLFAVVMNSYHWWLIASNLTTNEHLNKHRYVYLRDEMGRYRNAFSSGVLSNIGDFLTRSRTTSADPFVYTQRYNAQAMKQREIGYGDSSRSGDEMMPAKEGSQGLLSSEQQV